MREKADYQNVFSLDKEEGKALMASAQDLRKRICDYVNQKIALK